MDEHIDWQINRWLSGVRKELSNRVEHTFQIHRLHTRTKGGRDLDQLTWSLEHHVKAYFARCWAGQEDMIMAKRNRDFNWSMINVGLSEKQKHVFEETEQERIAELPETLLAVLTDGYKLSVTYLDRSSLFLASLSGVDEYSQNHECTINARHTRPMQAIALVIFKHLDICAGVKWKKAETGGDWG